MEVGARRNSAAATEAAANDPAAADASEEGSLQTYDCVLSPTDYWTLRDDPRWFQYVINSDPAPKTLIEVSRTEEDGVVKRVSKVTPERNPIPVLMRGTLGCKDGFTITMNETWKRGSFGKEHPMTFWPEPPVFKDRIRITGMQWVEPHPENATGCRIFFRLNVTVIGSGAAKTVAKGIEKGYLAGYAQLPARALEYNTLRRAAAEANDAAERLTARMTVDDDRATEVTPPYVDKRVRVVGLTGRADLNGQLGTANSYDEVDGRYLVTLDTGEGIKVRPDNLEALERDDPASLAGRRVTVHGLLRRPELNGKVGTLGLYDYREGRYQVRVEEGSSVLQVAIKPANLKLVFEGAGSVNGSGTTDAAARAAAAAAALVAGTSLRARLRWRMALMGVRFTRVLELQRNDDFRLCDARIDDPHTEGFGTSRHTTYRVLTQVRGGRFGWMSCRHRYAEFERLRASLLAFLPGVGEKLPDLPEKKAISVTAAVIAERVAGLEVFLQGVLDHPTLSTSDELAEFLTWPDEARVPIFARARNSLQQPPPNAQRRAMALAFSLRREAAKRRSGGAAETSPTVADGGQGADAPWVARPSAVSGIGTPKTVEKSAASSPTASPRTAQYVDPGYTDALAAAMMRTADDAATKLQRKARDRSARNSRITEDLDSVAAGAPAHRDSSTSRMAAATERFAARLEAAGSSIARLEAAGGGSLGGRAGGSMPTADSSILVVLHKLETIDARLQLMERRQSGSWLDGLIQTFSCGTVKPGGETW